MSQVSDYNAYTSAAQRKQEAYDAERASTRSKNEQEVAKLKEETADELTKAKAEYNAKLVEEKNQAHQEVRKLKEELYDQSGKNSNSDARAKNAEHEQLNNYADYVKKSSEKKIDQIEKHHDQRIKESHDETGQKIEDALMAQRKSDAQERRGILDELSNYRSMGKDLDTEKAKLRQEASLENETTNQAERNRIVEGYERQIKKLKNDQEQMAGHYNERLVDTLGEVGASSRGQLTRQKGEFIEVAKKEIKERQRLEDQFKDEVSNLKNRQSKAADTFIERTARDQVQNTKHIDETYQNYIAKKTAEHETERGMQEQKIHELVTNDDPVKASPQLTKRIAGSYEKLFNAKLNTMDEVNQKTLDATRNRDVNDRLALLEDYQGKFTELHRNTRKELDGQQRNFLGAYQDLSSSQSGQIETLQAEKKDITARMGQKHALDLVNSEKTKQDALSEQRETMIYDRNVVLDQADQAKRNQNREWFMKANEMRRGLESKLSDERENHEKTVTGMKLEFDKKLRDQERTSKRVTEDRVRNYEYQLKQQELAFKERERFLTEHYEEELDKMKRTNAKFIEKKS